MKINYLIAPLVLNCCLFFGQTPITLGNSNMPGSGDTLRYTDIQIPSLGNYTQTGVNFTWNFKNVVSTTTGLRSFKAALNTPYWAFFLTPNEYGEKIADTLGAGAFVMTKYYNYYKKQTNPVVAFVADGVGITFSNVPLPSYYSDKDELYNFPMTYPKYDSTSFKFSTLPSTLIPVRYSEAGYRITKVDGWGTITTPYGTEACLRLITTKYAMDSIKLSFGPINIPFGFPNVMRSYQWMTLNSKIPYFEVSGPLVMNTFSVTQARYRGYEIVIPFDVGIQEVNKDRAVQLYPNPVKDKVTLTLSESGTVQVMLYDSQGKLIRNESQDPGNANYIMDVSALQQGLYFIKTGQDCFKFIKQ